MDARLQRLRALVNSNNKGSESAAVRSDGLKSDGSRAIKGRRVKVQPQVIFQAERREEGEPGKVGGIKPSSSISTTAAQIDAETRQRMKELALERHRQHEIEERQKYDEAEKGLGLAQPGVEFTSAREQREGGEGDTHEGDDDEGEREREREREIVPLLRPVFVPRTHRCEATLPDAKDEQEEREREAQRLLIEYVRREYEASLPQENDNMAVNDPLSVDDTDPTDDIGREAELQAWKLRELLRVKRDRAAREHWEREQIELERIRNMTEEERRRLDEEKMREWQERPQSQMRFMQKYYHKGAFFMSEDEPLYQRDYAQATGEDAHANKEVLPEVKQVRDFGKKGRTKWTHLVGEDTTAFDYGWGRRKNEANYKLISRMGGMRGHLDNPSKRQKSG